MRSIPEGMMEIWTETSFKDRIADIQFTSQGVSLGVCRLVKDEDWDKASETLDKDTQRVLKEYYEKLSKEIRNTRNDMIDQIRIDVAKEKDEIIERAKVKVLELQEEIKLLKAKK